MGTPVLIMGKSGSGKSTSLRNFKEAAIINVLGKPLPFRNAPKTYKTDDYGKVISALTRAEAKSIVIDDAGYLMTNQFMKGHSSQGAGAAIFNFYNDIGDKFWNLISFVSQALPRETIVYFIMHEDRNDLGETRPKTIGKMLDEKVFFEGMFTVALRSMFSNGKYIFKTNTDGTDVCKSPIGMFDSMEIDNDLKFVDEKIREYFNLNESEEEKNGKTNGI